MSASAVLAESKITAGRPDASISSQPNPWQKGNFSGVGVAAALSHKLSDEITAVKLLLGVFTFY